MDIEKIRKLSKNATEAGELVKAVTAFKNELKDKEQMRDKGMSDYFKTLREPLIEQRKKTDEKQDRVIEELKKNQKTNNKWNSRYNDFKHRITTAGT